jgi:hypothetical protein
LVLKIELIVLFTRCIFLRSEGFSEIPTNLKKNVFEKKERLTIYVGPKLKIITRLENSVSNPVNFVILRCTGAWPKRIIPWPSSCGEIFNPSPLQVLGIGLH